MGEDLSGAYADRQHNKAVEEFQIELCGPSVPARGVVVVPLGISGCGRSLRRADPVPESQRLPTDKTRSVQEANRVR